MAPETDSRLKSVVEKRSPLRDFPFRSSYFNDASVDVEDLVNGVRGKIARFSLLIGFPVAGPLGDILVRILEAEGSVPLDVLVVIQDPVSVGETLPEQIGKLLPGLANRAAVSFRSVCGNGPADGVVDRAESVAILQGLEPNSEIVAVAVGAAKPHCVKVIWSWGDPQRRALTLGQRFAALWNHRSACPFIPFWDGLGLETKNHFLPALYPHQVEALHAWEANTFRGIFEMCTGAGKTVAALAGSLLLSQRLKQQNTVLSGVVILCPKRVLVDQWEAELLEKGFNVSAVVCDNSSRYRDQLDTALRDTKPRYIISTYDSFALPLFQSLLKSATAAGRRGLLIADEMHWCASAERRACLRACAEYFPWRLGLSATPEIESDPTATKQLSEYFGGMLEGARYGLEAALRDKVLCPYIYRPVPAFLDASTSAEYFDVLRRTSDSHGKRDLRAYSERRRILRKGELQIRAMETICDQIEQSGRPFHHTLVFCPPGEDFDDAPEDDEERTPLINKIKRVFQDRGVLCTSILADTNDRDKALEDFENETVSILLAIGCLDEGMDVPSTQRAIMLYSVDRHRQFVQRRGRVLRKHRAKDCAEIIDLIVLPHNADVPESIANDLLRRELRRYTEFARLAINGQEAQRVLEEAIQAATVRQP